MKSRRILSVFLASPGDVLRERDLAADVVDRFNKLIGPKLGLHIDLHRWEEIRPGYGRPQSIINPAVDSCDLFIGLLWERWGQPTGVYTSGFEEEFQRAKARRESTGQPEIWLVFKKPRPGKVEDPGSELRKVLDFRDEQRSSHQVLYYEVQGPEDWRTNLYDWLITHSFDQLESVAGITEQPSNETPRATQSSDTPLPTSSDQRTTPVPEQLVALSGKVARTVASGQLEFSNDEATSLSEFDIARLYLLSATWMARRYTSDFIGVHEGNLLYKHRNELDAVNAEEFQLLRTVLHQASDLIPGWFWFRDAFPSGPSEILFRIATEDVDSTLRARALGLLRSAQIRVPSELWSQLPLQGDSADVSTEALRYLGFVGDENALHLLKTSVEGENRPTLSAAAKKARYEILTRSDPKRAFAELIANESHPPAALIQPFGAVADALAVEDLLKGVESLDGDIRNFSAQELARRGQLKLDLAERLRDDLSTDAKQAVLQIIVNERGVAELEKLRAATKPLGTLDLLSERREVDLDSIELNYYKRLPPATLLEKIDWLSSDGDVAYKALATAHYDQISALIRTDLESGFTRIRTKAFEELKSEVGLDVATRAFDRLVEKKLDEFIRARYAEAALSGIASHAQPSDVQIARKYLRDENRNNQIAAARIISKFGGADDVQALLDISDDSWGELADIAPASAIRLSPNPNVLALEMAQAGGQTRRKAAIAWLQAQESPAVGQYFRSLLTNESKSNRILGVHYLSRTLNIEEAERLLNEYLGNKTYYYDVVTWLDRLLYAPVPLKEMYQRDLQDEATD